MVNKKSKKSKVVTDGSNGANTFMYLPMKSTDGGKRGLGSSMGCGAESLLAHQEP